MSNANLLPLSDIAYHLACRQWPNDADRDVVFRFLNDTGAGLGCYTPVYTARLLAAQRIDAQISQVGRSRIIELADTKERIETAGGIDWLVSPDQLSRLLGEAGSLKPEAESKLLADATFWKQTAEFEETRMTNSSAGKTVPAYLHDWMRLDTWLAKDAFRLLIGLEPKEDFFAIADEVEERLRIISARRLDGSLVCLNGWRNANVLKFILDRNEKIEIFDDELPATSLELIDMSIRLKNTKQVWESGEHADRNAPNYYIGWAAKKGFEIPWLDWATKEGLLSGSNAPVPIAPIPETSATRHSMQSGKSWQDEARKIADELFDHDTKLRTRNKLSGDDGYAARTAEALRERGITGPNAPLSPETVQREALQGNRWWATKSKA